MNLVLPFRFPFGAAPSHKFSLRSPRKSLPFSGPSFFHLNAISPFGHPSHSFFFWYLRERCRSPGCILLKNTLLFFFFPFHFVYVSLPGFPRVTLPGRLLFNSFLGLKNFLIPEQSLRVRFFQLVLPSILANHLRAKPKKKFTTISDWPLTPPPLLFYPIFLFPLAFETVFFSTFFPMRPGSQARKDPP